MRSSTACDNGINAAPHTPWSKRKITIWARLSAKPHNTEAAVKPATEIRKTRLMPKAPASHPVRGNNDRGGDDIGSQYPSDLILRRREAALNVRQRNIGDRRVDRLDDCRQHDRDRDRRAVDRRCGRIGRSTLLNARWVSARSLGLGGRRGFATGWDRIAHFTAAAMIGASRYPADFKAPGYRHLGQAAAGG